MTKSGARAVELLGVELCTSAAAAELLGVHVKTLPQMIADTPEVPPPRIDVGTGSRASWRWKRGEVLAWAQRRSEWRRRRSRTSEEAGQSDGATLQDDSTSSGARTSARLKGSAATSTERSRAAKTGRLRLLARDLASKK